LLEDEDIPYHVGEKKQVITLQRRVVVVTPSEEFSGNAYRGWHGASLGTLTTACGGSRSNHGGAHKIPAAWEAAMDKIM
jgi:hypothetical protein